MVLKLINEVVFKLADQWEVLLSQHVKGMHDFLMAGWRSVHVFSSTMDIRLMMIIFIILLLLYIALTGKKETGRKKSSLFIVANCWFCNTDNKIKQKLENNWYCKNCGQYNGFAEDGSYNRVISAMHAYQPDVIGKEELAGNNGTSSFFSGNLTHGKLCNSCNRMQILKVKQLSSFIPSREDEFDNEIDEYKNQLEKRYQICDRCSAMLKDYVGNQDMQIKQAIGDINMVNGEKDSFSGPEKEQRRVKTKPKSRWRFLRIFWPSNFLSMISLISAWYSFTSWGPGMDKFFLYGCTARLFLWLIQPFSKLRLLYLLIWMTMFVLRPMNMLLGFDLIWLRLILIFESWPYLPYLIKPFSTLLLRAFRMSKPEKMRKKMNAFRDASTSGNHRPERNSEEKQKTTTKSNEGDVQIKRRNRIQPQSDNIDGKISTMSLGLTDSEDETAQIKRGKSYPGSWYASASRFVTEADATRSTRQTKMEGTKFQLQPSRLYPNIHTEHGNLTVSENQDFNAKRTKPCVSEERCRQPISNKKSNLDGNNALNYHKGTQEKAKKLDYNSTLLRTCKFVIKLFFIIVVILSLILNIYLLSNKGN